MLRTFANSLPAAAWMLLRIYLDPSLLLRIQSEVDSIALFGTNFSEQLDSAPVLNAAYCETLRLYMAGTIGRTSPKNEVFLAGFWRICPGIPVMASSWLGGLDNSFWNTGQCLDDETAQYPLSTFWADRFLQSPDDPMSGPVKKSYQLRRAKTEPLMSSRDTRSRCVTSGLRNHWFPFGGGSSKCPGEALAKRTILCTVAVVLRCIDIRLDDPDAASKIRPRHRTLPFGLHSFDRAVPFHFRKK